MSRSSAQDGGPVEVLLDGFVGYLRSERGVSALTVEAYVSEVAGSSRIAVEAI